MTRMAVTAPIMVPVAAPAIPPARRPAPMPFRVAIRAISTANSRGLIRASTRASGVRALRQHFEEQGRRHPRAGPEPGPRHAEGHQGPPDHEGEAHQQHGQQDRSQGERQGLHPAHQQPVHLAGGEQGRLPHRQGDPRPARHQDADQDRKHLDDEGEGHRQDDHHRQVELGEDAFDLVPQDEADGDHDQGDGRQDRQAGLPQGGGEGRQVEARPPHQDPAVKGQATGEGQGRQPQRLDPAPGATEVQSSKVHGSLLAAVAGYLVRPRKVSNRKSMSGRGRQDRAGSVCLARPPGPSSP